MNLLPSEIIQTGIDTYLGKYPTNSRKIYLLVIGFITIALVALPFIYIDISVQDSGIIRPVVEKTEIRSSITEWVDSVYVKEGQMLFQTGSLLAVISPDSTLYAEIYVSLRNIGHISKDMPVHIQIGSFNYNEWGTVAGKVTEISSDFMTDASGSKVFYIVKCSMDRDFLMRKNGVKGLLKKGMPVSAHLMIARRSLFNLLYQKMDDWANPSQYQNNKYQ